MASLITVAIPTRNRKVLLTDAVRSVLNQTHQDIQLLVLDNNSGDGSQEHIREQFHDSRLEYHRSNQDLSMTENWSRGFDHARGEYFVRLDDDNVFFPDFLELACTRMKQDDLVAMIYSPLIIQLGQRLNTLFDPLEHYALLSKYQLAYLEFFCLTDSNYTLYRLKKIRDRIARNDLYKTTLPDRFLNYRVAAWIDENTRIGISSLPRGITRFDYRPRKNLRAMSYVDYKEVFRSGMILDEDCHSNFTMHRTYTLHLFLKEAADPDLNAFFAKRVLSPNLYLTLMRQGHINTHIVTRENLLAYNRYAGEIILSLMRHPLAPIQGRSGARELVSMTKHCLLHNGRALLGLDNAQASAYEKPDLTLGNKIIKGMFENGSVDLTDSITLNGSLEETLARIEAWT